MSETLTPDTGRRPPRRTVGLRKRRVRAGAVVAGAAAVGFVLWLILGSSGGGTSGPTLKGQATPLRVSVSGLRTLASVVGSPIYWVGTMSGVTYELTRTGNGNVYIRYLPSGVKIGTKTTYLTVATYPVSGAYAATSRAAGQKGVVRIDVGAGAVAFYSASRPQSIYFAQAGSNYQVEVFDPSASRARSLVASHRVDAVAGNAAAKYAAVAVSAKGLRTVATTLGHPVYWLGAKPGFTYELTQTVTGNVFVRYLPPRVRVGADKTYLTVATYPFQGAFAAIQKLATGKAAVSIKLSSGGLAVVDAQYPKSIHLAYPGVNYEVEVFDPSPAQTRQVVASGQVQPVG